MIISALLGLLGGLLIGGRFKVFALIPVLFAAVAVGTGLATLGGQAVGSVALDVLSFVISLQIGYAAMIVWTATGRKPMPARPLTT